VVTHLRTSAKCRPKIHRLIIKFFPLLQRLAKWFITLSPKDKAKIVRDVSQLVLSRRTRMCNFLEYKGASSQALSTVSLR
jgi:hypothetical protein